MASFSSDNHQFIKALGIGILIASVTTAVLSCGMALALNMIDGIPYSIIDYIMIGITAISVFIGAYIASAINKSKGLVIGAVCGVAVFLILTACGLCSVGNNISILTLIRGAVLIVCGIVGGVTGVNRKEKVRIK